MTCMTYKYFSNDDFQRATPSCNIADMSPALLQRLDRAREIAGIPFVVTSAYRPQEWEKSHGRSGNGAHPRGMAVDIRCRNSSDRWRIAFAAFAAGFPRIGVARGFVHLDICEDLPHPVLWTY